MNKKEQPSSGVAIIGMSCWYPGAPSLLEFWENILARRQQFRRMPDQRLPLDQYQDSNRSTPDKTYGTEAAVLDGFDFDWKGRRIPKQVFESTDIVHWLALDVALKALDDSGLDLKTLQSQQTGVILGNTLTGEWTRTNAMRMRWPFIEKVLKETASAKGIDPAELSDYIQSVEQTFKSVFPEVNEDTLAGALSNTIAGRICNFLDLHGGGYTVDGACSSSLLAVITAARNLLNRDLDVVFAGGIDVSLDTFELIGFAKTGALTPDEMRVYDRRANGFIPGEGCGFVVMKRLEDAQRDGDRIYAVLKGWGISSDGKGGMTAPSVGGQASAISKAYQMAGYGLEFCDFIEGHGTGTTVGDKVEISALVQVLGDAVPAQKIGLTSLKSIVGHTKAAAGIGAFIKTTIALNQRVLPPMAGVEEGNGLFQDQAKHFYPLMMGHRHAADQTLRAGVSAMGFGGINSHVTLESYGEPAAHLKPSRDEQLLFSSADRAEVLIFSAASQTQLQKKIDQTLQYVRLISRAELADLAADLARFVHNHETFRAAAVVSKPEEAFLALSKLKVWLEQPMASQSSRESTEGALYISLGHSTKAPKLGFLFPGQGSQKPDMSRKLMQRFDWAQDKALEADALTRSVSDAPLLASLCVEAGASFEEAAQKLSRTELAQPAISLSNALWLENLTRLGLAPSAVAGHSLGELSALFAAKAFDFKTLLKLAAKRGQLMAGRAEQPGSMIHLGCDAAAAAELASQVSGYCVIANRNAPDQTVLSGDVKALEDLLELAKKQGLRCGFLPVSNAFHSDYMQDAATEFLAFMHDFDMRSPQGKFFRGTDGRVWASGDDIKSYLSQQILEQVDFVALAESMRTEVDLMLEVGPSGILSGLIKRIHGEGVAQLCFATESRPGHDWDLKVVLATTFSKGSAIRWDELYRVRFLRPFVRPDTKHFIQSPTERPLVLAEKSNMKSSSFASEFNKVQSHQGASIQQPLTSIVAAPVVNLVSTIEVSAEQVIYKVIGDLTGFEASTLNPGMRLLDDLNMDSIKASELLANTAMHFGIAGELESMPYANASIAEIADAIRLKLAEKGASNAAQSSPTTAIATSPAPSALPAPTPLVIPTQKVAETTLAKNKEAWVRNFTEVYVPSELVSENAKQWLGSKINMVHDAQDQMWVESIKNEFEQQGAECLLIPEGLVESKESSLSVIRIPGASNSVEQDLEHMLKIFSRVGQSRWKKGHQICFVQFDDGFFGQSQLGEATLSAKAFAQSLAHERPDLKVTSLSLPKSQEQSLGWIISTIGVESATQSSPSIVGYDQNLQRLQPELQLDQPASYPKRDLTWNHEDVVVVTGGAKGITAACALAMAKTYGTKMALVGSSSFSESDAMKADHPIQATLLEYQKAGLMAQYYSCNISDALEVQNLIDRISVEMGSPTALIHGAGVNQPKPLISVSESEARREVSVKVLGMQNLLQALQGSSLKILMGLTSVIGVVGMPGNAWYGLANESLDLIIRRYGEKNKNTLTQTFAYSVWSELGMGARMGSDKNLEQKGISSIAPDQGVERFLGLIQGQSRDQQTIICSRMGSIAGRQGPRKPEQNLSVPFLRNILHYQPGVECIAATRLNWDEHKYLLDHNYKGAFLLPTVHGLEAMAQVVSCLKDVNLEQGLVLENIQLSRPITVSSQGCDIEVYAQVLEQKADSEELRIVAGIRTALTGYKVDHFRAEFVWQPMAAERVKNIPAFDQPLDLDPAQQLYGSILFQGPMFQRLNRIYHLESDNETEGRTIFTSHGNGQDMQTHLLGDPYVRDSLLQSAQIIIPQNQCLPIEIERLELHAGYRGTARRISFTDVYKADAKTYLATIIVFDEQGHVLEKLINYRLQFLEKRAQLPKAMDLLKGVSTQIPVKGSQNAIESAPSVALEEVDKGADLLAPYREVAERLLIDAEPSGPQDQSVFVHRFIPDFKTFANLSRSIYFSHYFNWMGSAREMSSLPVLDRIRALTETGRWGLVTNWASIEVLGECRNKDRVVEARMWCGRISGSKNSSATLTFDWVSKGENGIEERIATGQMGFTWVEILDHGIVRPAEFPEYYKDFIASMVAKNDNKDSFIPAHEPYRTLGKGNQLFKVPEGPNTAVVIAQKVFETSLFDANLVGNLYFGNYSIWMGKLRDSHFFSLAPQLYRGVGEQGELTCTKSRIQHLREAMPFDDILVTMAVKSVYEQGADLQFEFYKVTPEGLSEKLAIAQHEVIWTRQGADGEKVACALPEVILTALIEQLEISMLKTVI